MPQLHVYPLSSRKHLSSIVKSHNTFHIVILFFRRKAEMMVCFNVPLSIAHQVFLYVVDKHQHEAHAKWVLYGISVFTHAWNLHWCQNKCQCLELIWSLLSWCVPQTIELFELGKPKGSNQNKTEPVHHFLSLFRENICLRQCQQIMLGKQNNQKGMAQKWANSVNYTCVLHC